MNQSDRPRSARRVWGIAVGTLVVAGLAVVSFGSFAGADDTGAGSTSAPPDGARPHWALTDEQKQCLSAQGLTPPAKPADGTRPAPPTDEQRAAFRAAASACGITLPEGTGPRGPGFGRPALTDEQKQCLSAQGVTPPTKPADGTRPAPPTDEQRAAMRAAAEACGITFGPRPGGAAGSGGPSI